MGLSLDDMRERTIVDWTYSTEKKGVKITGKLIPRQEIRRGIIVRINGSIEEQSVQGVWIKFAANEKEVYCDNTNELVKVYDARTKVSREAWRRLMGGPREVGSIRLNKSMRVAPVVRDEMGVTPLGRTSGGSVEKAMEAAGIDDLIGNEDTYVVPEQDQPAEEAST